MRASVLASFDDGTRVALGLKRLKVMPRLQDDLVRHACELRDLQAVASVRGPILYGVQKHDAVAMLGRIQMDIRAAVDFVREARQLEIMRGEEREGGQLGSDVACDRPGERQSIKGARGCLQLQSFRP